MVLIEALKFNKNIRISNKTKLFVLIIRELSLHYKQFFVFIIIITNLIIIKLFFKWDIDWIYINKLCFLINLFYK